MKLKTWIMGTLLGVSPVVGIKTAAADKAELAKNVKTEVKYTPTKSSMRSKTDSIVGGHKDSLQASMIDSLYKDSIIRVKFQEAEYDMLCLVAHCEGIALNAYFDTKAKIWTIGFGNTIRPDGKKVTSKDKIRSEKELMEYFHSHVQKSIFGDMKKYLPLDKMSSAEIASVGSFLYNCGTGVLHDRKNNATEFAQNLSEYILTRSERAKGRVQAYMDTKVTAKGKEVPALKKRRELEKRILFGDLVLDNKGELKLSNSVNFSEVSLGGIYSIGDVPADSTSLASRLEEVRGRNLNDSIQHAMRTANVVRRPSSKSR